MRRRLLLCIGGGVVEGLLDSKDIEPRVRFGVRLGASVNLTDKRLSNSFVLTKPIVDNFVCELVMDLSKSNKCLNIKITTNFCSYYYL